MSLQVVDALTHIMEGKICGIVIKDWSLVRSDSFYSTSDSGESLENGMNKSESESESPSTECTSTSNSYVSYMISGLQIPPSPPMDTSNSRR